MISKEFAIEQLKRLAGLSYFPTERAAANELAVAIMAAETDEIARSVIGEVIAMSSKCPTPTEIRKLMYGATDKAKAWSNEGTLCDLCGGIGFISFERGGCAYARPCDCRRAAVTA